MKIHFPAERVGNYAQYQIFNDHGDLVFSCHGPIAASAAEIIFKALANEEELPSPREIFARHNQQQINEIGKLTEEENKVMEALRMRGKLDKYWYNWDYINGSDLDAEALDKLAKVGFLKKENPWGDSRVEVRMEVLGITYLGIEI